MWLYVREYIRLIMKKSAKSKSSSKAKKKALKPRPGRVDSMMAVADDGPGDSRIQRWYRPRKLPVTLRLDAEILDWFQRGGRGYQTRINHALRGLVAKAKGR